MNAPGRPSRGPRRQHGGEDVQVPRADFRSYYGRPILKAPVWRHDVPAYLFTGGLAAGSALLAAGADLTGRPVTRRAARLAALGALGASTYFLINDLGRPERFHHMLRVAKPTSPMSVGTWLLSAFGGAAGLAAVSEAAPRGRFGRAARAAGRAAGVGAAALAPGLATYTAVLIADTAAPSWHEAYPQLPFAFAGSALASGAAVGLIAAPVRESGPARGMAVAGVALELAATHRIETAHGLLSEPYRTGRAGRLLRAARALNLAGAAGALLGRRSRVLSALSGAALLAGSLATRFGVFEAGVESTKDPRYVVEPQKRDAGP
ncbi:polysulfide reductase NrfD [Dactylosporangium fulvum]|uniref:Polysulfide reductase NrfD n=1 Tax=Dactylosporangium fulvum TaxID=53359 RepID=A0ABY5VPM4_9ACTN|nr:NrfD/PsrC family molybdoenzyme membrane anchor subunit [Dactylosporangium fulvum]UWP78751.1 polysulfide reductase NrfD [Dactylosporangium fulvum]